MIEINLLPEELRKKKARFAMPKINIALLPALAGAGILMLLLPGILALLVTINNSSYEKMSGEWAGVKGRKVAVDILSNNNREIKKKIGTIKSLMEKRVSWSKKLNQLSDLILPGVWFTSISIDAKSVAVKPEGTPLKKAGRKAKKAVVERIEIPCLAIEGNVSPQRGEELAIIGKFIESLKSNSDFFRDFSSIELDSTELLTIGEIEVMKFSINCYFRKAGK